MPKIARWAHIGDLHMTDRSDENYRDLIAIVGELASEIAAEIDFVYLPGDSAENGTAAQYAIVREALAPLSCPIHVITGDHDMEPGHLEAFYRDMNAQALPYAVTLPGYRCLFLDLCGTGSGGPDFRLGAKQMAWLSAELAAAASQRQSPLVFMHSYPADLRDEAERSDIVALFRHFGVVVVDMGHTHYNEIANDGRTIFAATRSTGQIEEGPPGYSLTTIDDGVVSWRFKELAQDFPLVMITTPADHRLVTDTGSPAQIVHGTCRVRAVVFGKAEIASCSCRIDDGPMIAMSWNDDDQCWSATTPSPGDQFTLTVQVTDVLGRSDTDSIEVATSLDEALQRHADGSDADAIGAWPQKNLLGTQLGPNRNGKKW